MVSRILLVTGPAGAGKSTAANSWASTRTEPCAQLSLDTFRQFIKAGYADPRNGWNDETRQQLDIARSNMASAVKNYLSSGVQVVLDDAVFPNWEAVNLDQWQSLLPDIEIDLVVLLPEWGIVQARNSDRGEHDFVPEDILRTIYDDMSGWRERSNVTVIDNSVMTVDDTVSEIDRLLASSS